MSNPLCEPFDACDAIDGKLLISTALQGPPLAWDPGEISLGDFQARGAVVRPFLDILMEQHWSAKEACYGPVRSVLSLAPGETVELFTSVRTELDLGNLMETASGATRHSTRGGPLGGGGMAGHLELPTRLLGGYGSILDDIGDVLGAVEGAAKGLVGGVVDLVSHAVGGGGPGVTAAVDAARQAVETIDRTESRQDRTQRTSSTERETVQTIRRTFANPYRDRSLQLRFVPVFRRFEVRTLVTRVQPGVAAQYGSLHVAPQASLPAVQSQLNVASSAFAASDQPDKQLGQGSSGSIQRPEGPPRQLNQAQSAVTTKAGVSALQKPLASMVQRATPGTGPGAKPTNALAWSQSYVRDDSLHVPLADAKAAASALKLAGKTKTAFDKAISLTLPAAVAAIPKTRVQVVHLFMGTHIEAVAGDCILVDLPPQLVNP